MSRKVKTWLWVLGILILYFGISMAIRASLSPHLADRETALLREELISFWDSEESFYADVLYDSQGTPMWMYGECKGGSVILNRITQQLSEAGELRYYKDYHDVRKYYAAPLGHIVEAGYVPDDIDSADEGYFFMGPNRHLDSFSPGLFGWIWSNLKLPIETLKSLLAGNALPIKF